MDAILRQHSIRLFFPLEHECVNICYEDWIDLMDLMDDEQQESFGHLCF